MTDRTTAIRRARVLLALLFLAPVAAVAAQEWLHPGGLFNQGRAVFQAVAAAGGVLGVLCAGLALLGPRQALLPLAALFVAVSGAELSLRAFDALVVDRPDGRPGLYHNRGPAILLRPHTGGVLGLDIPADTGRQPPPGHRRVLFLGDSYTYGSGSTRERSYVAVAGAALARGRPDLEVLNAGVPGHSPRDSLEVLCLLGREGWRYDAVVFSLFTLNDFTDSMPGTHRRALGGFIHRLPDSPFLGLCHPANSYLFRYAVNTRNLFRQGRDGPPGSPSPPEDPDGGPCRPAPDMPGLLSANYHRSSRPDRDGALAALRAMARECGVPFHLVIFPDPSAVDAGLREQARGGLAPGDFDFHAHERWLAGQRWEWPVLDLGPAIAASGNCCYRDRDTHLNDRGNRLAGEAAAAFLLSQPWSVADPGPDRQPQCRAGCVLTPPRPDPAGRDGWTTGGSRSGP